MLNIECPGGFLFSALDGALGLALYDSYTEAWTVSEVELSFIETLYE